MKQSSLLEKQGIKIDLFVKKDYFMMLLGLGIFPTIPYTRRRRIALFLIGDVQKLSSMASIDFHSNAYADYFECFHGTRSYRRKIHCEEETHFERVHIQRL